MKATDFTIGDRVKHLTDPHTRWAGTVVAIHENLNLVRVEWDGCTKQEWLLPDEIRLREVIAI